MIHLSLTETESLAAKAARGAGLSWGMAEEAGMATRWLQAQGLPGPAILLAHLTEIDGAAWQTLAPHIHPHRWASATGGPLCPLATGATLSDHAALITTPLTLQAIAQPALLLPFLANTAQHRAAALRIEAPTGHAILNGNDLWLHGPATWLTTPTTLIIRETVRPITTAPRGTPPAIPAATLAALNAFALRTTVPPSAQSRAGAGASGSDND